MEVSRSILLFAVCLAVAVGNPTSRIIGGIPVDTFRRFPHHVTIHTLTGYGGVIRYCSGSIIARQWLLSSIGCVAGGSQYRLDFNRPNLKGNAESYSVLIDKSNVIYYPTYFDDMALIKIPLELQYSEYVKNISLVYDDNWSSANQFAVLPGFGNNSDTLTYGMFQITSDQDCETVYGNDFDKYTQLCTRGWNNNNNVPCNGNQGGGLIVGWPRNPRLVGVFSSPLNCKSNSPAIYMKVSKYTQWIQSITGELEEKPTTTVPTTIWTTEPTTTAAPLTTPESAIPDEPAK